MDLKKRRNPGMPLNLDWVMRARVNRSAVERRTATLPGRRSIKKEWQAAWLLRAITCIDLTTLSGDDTPGRIRRLCAKARQPVRPDMLEALGVDRDITVGAVCVYPSRVRDAVEALQGTRIPVASVATGFPAGQTPLPQRIAEIEQAIEAGAAEVDVVITRTHVLTGNWAALYDELRQFRETCGEAAHMKTILGTGDLGTLLQVYQASLVAMMAGTDFIKTSTGKESVNATLEFGLVMTRAIRDYCEQTGSKVGFKPAGGINSAKQALAWQALMKEELGVEWLMPDLFRIGASSLLTDLERQLYHYTTGHYAARHHMPMG
jgi:deoxyribose-phosphate aldolase